LEERAEIFAKRKLMSRMLRALRIYFETIRTDRVRTEARLTVRAHVHHQRTLVKKVWLAWRLHRRSVRAKATTLMSHFSSFIPKKRAFKAWIVACHRSWRQNAYRWRDLCRRGDLSICRFYLLRWKEAHKHQLEDREVEKRMESKWAEVQQWLYHK